MAAPSHAVGGPRIVGRLHASDHNADLCGYRRRRRFDALGGAAAEKRSIKHDPARGQAINIHVNPANAAPTLDLDDSGGGTGFNTSYTEGGSAVSITDSDVLITDADAGDMIEKATINIQSSMAGDTLTVVGALPAGIAIDNINSTPTHLVLIGTASAGAYQTG